MCYILTMKMRANISPVFVLHPRSSILAANPSGDALDANPIEIEPGPFWSNAKAVATTQIVKTQNSLNYWSLVSGTSKNSVDAGLSLPFGKVTVGAKFGFERETSNSRKSSTEESETHLTAMHNIPCVQININETTVALSSSAEYDLKKLRRERRFADLMSFIDKYGMI